MSTQLRKFAASQKSPEKSPTSQVTPLVSYPSSESMDGDSADESTNPAPIENGQIDQNGHSTEDNRTSVDKYFISEVNDNTIPDLNLSTAEMGPCTDQIQCESSNVADQPVFSSNEIYENPENNSVNILIDGLVPNQTTAVSYGADLAETPSLVPPTSVHQLLEPPPVQTNQPAQPSSTMMILDDDEPPRVAEPENPNGQVPEAQQFPDDASYYMPADNDSEVAKAWGQFPQWARYDAKNKAYTLPKKALLEGRDLKSGITKLRRPPPMKPNEAYLANEQVDFNCFYEFVERTRTNPEQIGKCAFISSTTWVAIAPESQTSTSNRKICYDPAYQDKNSPKTRCTDPVLKAFYGGTGRAKHMKYFREKIDYFEIDQIFIPIIEEEHWSLAIVNHPRKAFKKLLQGITRQQVAHEEDEYANYSKTKERLTRKRDELLKEINRDRSDLEFIKIDVDAELEKFKNQFLSEAKSFREEQQAEEDKMIQRLEEQQQAEEEAMEEDEGEHSDEDESEDDEPSDEEKSSDQEASNELEEEENTQKEDDAITEDTPVVEAPSTSSETKTEDDSEGKDQTDSKSENPDESGQTETDTEKVIDKLEEQTLESKEEPMETTTNDEATVKSPEQSSEQPTSEPKEEPTTGTNDEKEDDNDSCPTDSEIPDGEPNNLEPSADSMEDQNKEVEQESNEPSEQEEPGLSVPVLERINRIYRQTNDVNRLEEQINSLEEVKAPEEPSEDDPVIYILCSLRNGEEKGRMKCDAINHVLSGMFMYKHDSDKRIAAFDKYREELKTENQEIYDLWTDPDVQHWKDLLPFAYRFPLVPHQVNDYDCGLFVSKFIEMYLNKENRPPMTANKTELETMFPPREIFDLKFKYRNILHELRGSEKEIENQDGTPEDNGYLATLEESLNWGREKKMKDADRMRAELAAMRSDSEDYSTDEEDSEFDEEQDEEEHMDDLYGEYQVGDLGRRDEYPNNLEDSIQPNFQSFQPQNTNEYDYQNDNEEESEDDTRDAIANALASIKQVPNVREIKKSDHSLNELVPDAVSETKSDLPQQENATPVLEESSTKFETQNSDAAKKEYLPDKIETLQSTSSIDNTHPNAAETEKESEPKPKLPKPSSPAVQKSAVRIKTTIDTPVKDQTEIPKTRQKTSDETKEIRDKKLKDKQDRLLAIKVYEELNARPKRSTRQSKELTPTRRNSPNKKSQKVTRRKTISVPTIAAKPVRKQPLTPKTEPRTNQFKRRRIISTSSTTSSKPQQPTPEPTSYSEDLNNCWKIDSYTKRNRRFDQRDPSILKTLSEMESTPKPTSSNQNGLDSRTSSGKTDSATQ